MSDPREPYQGVVFPPEAQRLRTTGPLEAREWDNIAPGEVLDSVRTLQERHEKELLALRNQLGACREELSFLKKALFEIDNLCHIDENLKVADWRDLRKESL